MNFYLSTNLFFSSLSEKNCSYSFSYCFRYSFFFFFFRLFSIQYADILKITNLKQTWQIQDQLYMTPDEAWWINYYLNTWIITTIQFIIDQNIKNFTQRETACREIARKSTTHSFIINSPLWKNGFPLSSSKTTAFLAKFHPPPTFILCNARYSRNIWISVESIFFGNFLVRNWRRPRGPPWARSRF